MSPTWPTTINCRLLLMSEILVIVFLNDYQQGHADRLRIMRTRLNRPVWNHKNIQFMIDYYMYPTYRGTSEEEIDQNVHSAINNCWRFIQFGALVSVLETSLLLFSIHRTDVAFLQFLMWRFLGYRYCLKLNKSRNMHEQKVQTQQYTYPETEAREVLIRPCYLHPGEGKHSEV